MDIRWLIRKDMAEVCRIDRLCFQSAAMDEVDFLPMLKQRNCVGSVAVDESGAVVGYVIYALHRHSVEILRLAVHPLDQKQGVGSAIIDRLRSKLEINDHRQAIIVTVADCETDCLLWLQRRGFVATDCGADMVTMTWSTVAEWRQWRVPVDVEVGER